MPTVLRRLVPIVFVVILLAALAPETMAATTHLYPNQSLGNRGTDVRAIQGLLRAHGVAVANTGIFEATTRDAVVTFQSTHGLPVDGVVRMYAKSFAGTVGGDAARRLRDVGTRR